MRIMQTWVCTRHVRVNTEPTRRKFLPFLSHKTIYQALHHFTVLHANTGSWWLSLGTSPVQIISVTYLKYSYITLLGQSYYVSKWVWCLFQIDVKMVHNRANQAWTFNIWIHHIYSSIQKIQHYTCTGQHKDLSISSESVMMIPFIYASSMEYSWVYLFMSYAWACKWQNWKWQKAIGRFSYN